MKVKLNQAIKLFFGRSSLEMVYFEAIANSLDAGATEIEIDISISAINQPETLKISITDNGVGFTKERLDRFSRLLDVEEESHKGVGRLVYLCYFEKVEVNSFYDRTRNRRFVFTDTFDEKAVKDYGVKDRSSGTTLSMSGYLLTRLHNANFIGPEHIKQRILEEFYPKLFQLKKDLTEFSIKIKTNIDDDEFIAELTHDDIADLKDVRLESAIDLISEFTLYYSIEKLPLESPSLIAAICVDHRTYKIDLIAPENVPPGYKLVFLLYSDWFIGKTDVSRQNLNISDYDLKQIKKLFRKKVASLIKEKIPQIAKVNAGIEKNLTDRFPHLAGYFETETIGFASRSEVLHDAQEKFFKAQRELLDANSLTEAQYEQSIELSARALTEYILFRQITIDKLKNTTKEETEAELHNLFAKRFVRFDKDQLVNDIYRNNAWLLDDKYMTYETVLSDRSMGELIELITEGEMVDTDENRPDLAIVFSGDPDLIRYFDVVIVEIKKRGVKLEDNMTTETQLVKRARRLMAHYNNRIQRIWYYGLVEFNEELEIHLSGEYKELFSHGKMYYKPENVAIQLHPRISVPIGIFMWDIDAVAKDANARNSAFLNLIKSKFRTSQETG